MYTIRRRTKIRSEIVVDFKNGEPLQASWNRKFQTYLYPNRWDIERNL